MIRLIDVWYRYEDMGNWVVKGITIAFNPREIVILRGANGAGKTTLMKIASLLYRPSKGVVLVDGVNVWKTNAVDMYRRRIVYIHDRPIMFSGTVYDNLAYGLIIRGYSDSYIEKAVNDIAELLGIKSLLQEKAKNLSMGQKQLIAIGRALVLEPEMMFIDEPFTNLDREKRNRVIEILNSYKLKGRGIVIATHLYESIERLDIDRTIYIDNGVLISEDRYSLE
ncbi:ABC transporter related [Ignisphaera aggregans DSM 17230]|uniref:ABC transporter related n=1 Tax=Ignisphaera aggregans (strain DSM 17230 / JCM 13409 / AQ1.S1) TaxID=583356 RepID=E0STU1_IGNAA|nr:ABC transporter related [Ignisphaera aggregans DSM 17230]